MRSLVDVKCYDTLPALLLFVDLFSPFFFSYSHPSVHPLGGIFTIAPYDIYVTCSRTFANKFISICERFCSKSTYPDVIFARIEHCWRN